MKVADVMGGPPGEAAAPSADPSAAGPPPGAQQAPGENPYANMSEETTPEEDAQYEKVVMAAGEILYDKNNYPNLERMFNQMADDPAKAISGVATMIYQQLDQKSGGNIPEAVQLGALAEITELVADLAKAKGVFEVDDAMLQRAGQYSQHSLMSTYDISDEEGKMFMDAQSPEDIQAAGAQALGAWGQPAPGGAESGV